jgi:translation initiation factor 2 subunit 1
MEFEEDELVLGVVEKVENMNAFVRLSGGKIGTIVTSEIAPGRIKNLREYVAPNKIVVCKILRTRNGHIDLSLRRVTAKEKQEVLAGHKREKDIEGGMKAILKDSSQEIIKDIKKDFQSLTEFVEKAQLDKRILSQYIPAEYLVQIEKLTEKKKKEVEIRKSIKLKCFNSEGVSNIKELFAEFTEKFQITYISAGNYLVVVKAEDYKKANNIMQEFSEELEEKSKRYSCELTIEEKK